ncbi:hypothetical protein HDK64DRAFT_328848 [Phyllosticta capitalensis]
MTNNTTHTPAPHPSTPQPPPAATATSAAAPPPLTIHHFAPMEVPHRRAPRDLFAAQLAQRVHWRMNDGVHAHTTMPYAQWTHDVGVGDIKKCLRPHLGRLEFGGQGATDEGELEVRFLAEGEDCKDFLVRRGCWKQVRFEDEIEGDAKDKGKGKGKGKERARGERAANPEEEAGANEYVFHVLKPGNPFHTTRSTVATMELVRTRTTIPVPRVCAFDTSAANAVGYEWILMERVRGVPLLSTLRSPNGGDGRGGGRRHLQPLTDDQKRRLARTLADWTHQLTQLRFDAIGSVVWQANRPNGADGTFAVGPLVTRAFVIDWRPTYRFSRGPYTHISSYLRALVDACKQECDDGRQHRRALIRAANVELGVLEADPWAPGTAETVRELLLGMTSEQRAWRVAELRAWLVQLMDGLDGDDDVRGRPAARRRRAPARRTRTTVDWRESRFAAGNLVSDMSGPRPRLRLPQEAAQCDALYGIIDTICPSQPLDPRSTFLQHWDIHGDSILIDPSDDMRPVALLGWERVLVAPGSLLRHTYPLLFSGGEDALKRPRWDEDENKAMREEYCSRLRELNSPLLEVMRKYEGVQGDVTMNLRELEITCLLANHHSTRRYVDDLVQKVAQKFGPPQVAHRAVPQRAPRRGHLWASVNRVPIVDARFQL